MIYSGAWKPLILRGGVVAIAAAMLTGCSWVKPEELESSLADLRAEMAAGDERLAGDLGSLEERVGETEGRLQALERELGSLASEFNATVERFETALRFDMPIYFGFDEDELTPAHRDILDRFAGVIREFYPGCLITAEGFTDPAGSVEYNMALGLRRAEAVTAFLATEGGLSPEQLKAVSYGEASNRRVVSDAFGPGDNGWENRRVALVVDHGGA
jgi:peptidoglycan-associated lipoprotein